MTLLIFDCDGTLTDTEWLHSEVDVEFMYREYGLALDVEELNRLFTGTNCEYVERVFAEKLGRPLREDHAERLFVYKRDEFCKRAAPCVYVHEALAELQDCLLAVASNALMRMLEVNLRAADLYDLFAPRIYSRSMVGDKAKPAPDLFLHAARDCGIAPPDCIVVEDSEHGVAAGRAADMRVIGYAGGRHCYPGYAEKKLGGADLVIDDMRDLPKAVRFLA